MRNSLFHNGFRNKKVRKFTYAYTETFHLVLPVVVLLLKCNETIYGVSEQATQETLDHGEMPAFAHSFSGT